jgi:hypothetical protein
MNKEAYKTDPEDITMVYVDENLSIKRHIVCAANLVDGMLVCGARHHDPIMREVYDRLGLDAIEHIRKEKQGFIDQYGQFVTREDAAFIVKANDQKLRSFPRDICFSEDLY